MDLAKGRKLLLERIAPEEALTINALNEDEVMLLLSEVYQERITGPEIQFYKIRRLKPIFSKKKKKGKKSKVEQQLESEVKYLKSELQEIKNLLKSKPIKQSVNSHNGLKTVEEYPIKQTVNSYSDIKTVEQLRKDKLKDILTRDVHKYADTEVAFMLSSVYDKNLSEDDKFMLKLK